MTITRHDFSRPPPLAPNLRASLAQWMIRSNAMLAELLTAMSASVELQFVDSSTQFPAETLSQWTDRSLAIQLSLGDKEDQSLIVLPNPLVQELVGAILGDRLAKSPGERSLTPVEMSVAEFLVETIARSLNECWQGDGGLELSRGEVEVNLRRTKRFRPADPVVVCQSTTRTSLGESRWCWLVSHDFLARLFRLPRRTQLPSDNLASRKHLERLVRGMRAEIEIRLGEVQLTGPQLANLRVGDVVVLSQRVGEPLLASVRGEPKFLGWAGRTGNRQSFEIESEVQQRYTSDVPEVA